MKTRTTLCALICILIPLNTQALPKLSQIFPCLKKYMHKKVVTTQIPTPTLVQRCLIISKKIVQSKITQAAVATTIFCICTKKVWDYIQSLRIQLSRASDQLRTERTSNQDLQQRLTEQNQQATTHTEQLTQAQRQTQEHKQRADQLAQQVEQLQQQTALSEASHRMQLQNTQQALEALQTRIDRFPLAATERLNAQAARLTTLGQQLQQLKDALPRKTKASRPLSTKKGKSSSEASSHMVRAQGRYAPQPLYTDPQSSRINPKIKPDIPHFCSSRHCEACKTHNPSQT